MSSNGDREGLHIDGEVYPMPVDFTFAEAFLLKEHFQVTPKTLIEGMQEDATDPDILFPLAWIALHRSDPKIKPNDKRLMEAGIGALFGTDDEVEVPDQGDPPTLALAPEA